MIGPSVAAIGVALLIVGLVVTFGAWTLIPAGVALAAVGVLVDLEGAMNGKSASTAP